MLVTRSNRQVGELGRLLLFAVQEQVHDTNDQDADLNEIRIRDHLHHPLLCSGGGKKFRPPPEEGASRLPNTGSASAYPCAGDIIARFVEFGKMGEKPSPRGREKRNPPAGDGLPRRCTPSNDVELGIDFFPYHVILKIKRGAAGRREPLGLTEVTVSVLG